MIKAAILNSVEDKMYTEKVIKLFNELSAVQYADRDPSDPEDRGFCDSDAGFCRCKYCRQTAPINGILTAWELDFVRSIKDQHNKGISLTEKQYLILEKIYRKMLKKT